MARTVRGLVGGFASGDAGEAERSVGGGGRSCERKMKFGAGDPWERECKERSRPRGERSVPALRKRVGSPTRQDRKEGFLLVPAETKSIRFSSGTARRKTRGFRQKLQTTSHLQSPARILWDQSHYTVTPHALFDLVQDRFEILAD